MFLFGGFFINILFLFVLFVVIGFFFLLNIKNFEMILIKDGFWNKKNFLYRWIVYIIKLLMMVFFLNGVI